MGRVLLAETPSTSRYRNDADGLPAMSVILRLILTLSLFPFVHSCDICSRSSSIQSVGRTSTTTTVRRNARQSYLMLIRSYFKVIRFSSRPVLLSPLMRFKLFSAESLGSWYFPRSISSRYWGEGGVCFTALLDNA